MDVNQQIHTCRIQPSQWSKVAAQLKDSDIRWIRFGDELAVFSTDEASTEFLSGVSTRVDARFSDDARTTREQNLYVVSQKGRLFEEDHRDVEVIIDKGRFLLVELTDAQVAGMRERDEPCYALRRYEPNSVVFDSPGRPVSRRASPAWVQTLVSKVKESSIRGIVEKLVSFRTRHSTSDQYMEAANWCKGELEGLGYRTRLSSVSVDGSVSQNVIGQREGSRQGERKQVLVTAHLDSVNTQGGPAADAPGADDNASGSAGVLEIARVLKDHPNVDDFRLILFGGEEQRLFGSRQYVSSLSAEHRARIKAVINMDMIGNQNTLELSVLLEGGEVSRGIIEDLQDAAANHTSLEVQTSFFPHNSDHEPFIDEDIPAVLTIEGADGSNTDIHTARDTMDKIDFELAVEILRMNVAFTALGLGKGSSIDDRA